MTVLTVHHGHLTGDPWLGDTVKPHDIAEIHLNRFPPEVHLHDGRIGWVSRQHTIDLEQFALLHDLAVVNRLDVWGALLEPYLDTELGSRRRAELNAALRDVGFTRKERTTLDRFLSPWMLAWTAITWEWAHYGMSDLLEVAPRNLKSLVGLNDPMLPDGVTLAAVRRWAEGLARRGQPGERIALPLPIEDGATWGTLKWMFPSTEVPDDQPQLRPRLEGLKQQLMAHWQAPHRHYHTLTHLRRVLGPLTTVTEGRTTLQLAAWFHDAIYDTTRTDNEAASAAWLEREADLLVAATSATAAEVAEAARVIRTTGHPLQLLPEDDTLGRRFWDADFGIFATAPVVYEAYTRDVRAEWAHVSDEAFVAGRAAFLQALHDAVTARGFFFYSASSPFAEAMAQANLARELAALQAR